MDNALNKTNHIVHRPLTTFVRDAEYAEEISEPLLEYRELCIPANPQPCGYKLSSSALKALKCDQKLSFSKILVTIRYI